MSAAITLFALKYAIVLFNNRKKEEDNIQVFRIKGLEGIVLCGSR